MDVRGLSLVCTQTSLPAGYRLSMVDVGLVIESLIGGAYCSSYTRKAFRAACSRLQKVRSPQLVPLAASAGTVMNLPSTQPRLREGRGPSLSRQRLDSGSSRSPHQLHFFRTAQPSKPKVEFSLRLPENSWCVHVCMCACVPPHAGASVASGQQPGELGEH